MPTLNEYPKNFLAIRATTRSGKTVYLNSTTSYLDVNIAPGCILTPDQIVDILKKAHKGQYKISDDYINPDSLSVVEIKWSEEEKSIEDLDLIDDIRTNALSKLNNLEAEILGLTRQKVYAKLQE